MTEVSVVIPTRNRRQLLELTLRSVLWQCNVEFELIVVDDGSTDDTPLMLRGLGSQVRVIRHERPQGVSAARNRGIAEAGAEWVAFLDDDDLWAPEKLELQLEALRRDRRRWAYAGIVEIAMDNRIVGGQPPAPPDRIVEELLIRNMLPAGASNVIAKKAWLPTPTVFDGSLHHSADWDLWIRLARQGPPAFVPKPLVAYRFHSGSASLDLDGMFSETYEIDRRYGGRVDRSGYNRHLARLAKRTGWGRMALRHYWRAAAGSPSYAMTGFVPDMWNLLSDVGAARGYRIGIEGLKRVSARTDPHTRWKEEARRWVERLLREDGNRTR